MQRLMKSNVHFLCLYGRIIPPVRSFTGMDRNGPNYRNGLPEWTLIRALEHFSCTLPPVRSFTGMDRNGPNYRNGLPEWTLIRALEHFSCILLGQSGIELPKTVIIPKKMHIKYPKIWPHRIG